jgi:hypothetical protein
MNLVPTSHLGEICLQSVEAKMKFFACADWAVRLKKSTVHEILER